MQTTNPHRPGWLTTFFVGIVLLALAGCGLEIKPEPVPTVFMEPSGPHAVSRVTRHLIDSSRPEVYTAATDDVRELVTTLYYPAAMSERAAPRPWLDAHVVKALSDVFALEESELAQISAHARINAPVSKAQCTYPVIVTSHGDAMLPVLYTSYLETLASHGYIVVSVTHPYNAPLTVFPNGRRLLAVPEASAAFSPLPPDAPLWEATQAAWQHGQATLALWRADAEFVLDELVRINVDDAVLKGKFDLGRVGMFGHSFGGATATEMLTHDPRIRAAANLDGSLFDIYEGITMPLMNIVSRDNPEIEPTDELLEQLGLTRAQFAFLQAQTNARRRAFEASTDAYHVTLRGSEHLNFSDAGLLTPIFPADSGQLGTINPERALAISSDYLVAFFDTFLKDKDSPLLQIPGIYAEAVLETSK